MNILFVSDKPFNPIAGGIERVTDIIARELKKRGHNVFYLSEKAHNEIVYLLEYDFPAKLFMLPEYDGFNNNTNLHFYGQLQKEIGIDIVINQRGVSGWFNGMLPETRSKLVSVLHTSPDSALRGLSQTIANASCPPFAKMKRIAKKTFPFAFKMYWRGKIRAELVGNYTELVRFSDAVVALSSYDCDLMFDYVSPEYRGKLHSIGNPNSFEQGDSAYILQKHKEILFVGRLDRSDKAPMRVLKIWDYLNNASSEWRLKIVGDGPERTDMEEYVKRKNLKNVFFEGRQKDVSKYYKDATFVCLTSNYEGWGMALTEGMQYGCIPFTFNNYGAASEIIDDDINGCLIPAFDLKRYAGRLMELIDDESRRQAMAIASFEKVKTFSVRNIVDQWEKLFMELKTEQP